MATIYLIEKGQPVFFDYGTKEQITKRAGTLSHLSIPYLIMDENQKVIELCNEQKRQS